MPNNFKLTDNSEKQQKGSKAKLSDTTQGCQC